VSSSLSFTAITGCPSAAAVTILLLMTLCAALLVWVNHNRSNDSSNMIPSSSSSQSSSSSSSSSRLLMGDWNDFPDAVLDLWPRQYRITPSNTTTHNNDNADSVEQQLQRVALRNCLPSDSVYCHERWIGTTQHVAILRPPGVLGSILEDFVLSYIDASRTEDMDMVVKVHSAVSVVHDYTLTQVIRPTVLPILLHAMDLILETLDGDFTIVDVTVRDVVSVV
jgi:hypothetical protein